jgi:aconitate hydratase
MGVLPLQFPAGKTADDLGLTGEETISISGITELNDGTTPRTMTVSIEKDGRTDEFEATVRIDTPGETSYYRNGGIMPFVLRNLLRD